MDHIQELAEELLALRQQGSQATVYAANVDEAVAVSERLRELGKAQWFRGQIQNWPKLTPSVYRNSSEAEFEQARSAINRFGNWVKSTPGLEEIAASSDAMIAVAQHYGMPTTFIDFTIDPYVAGYFASTSKKQIALGTESCIYCLDIEEADSIWRYMSDEHYSRPERLILDVPNLWRLEAQKGVFVYCPYDDLNGPYPIDRIIFPYQGPVSAPSDAEIYPERESVLEALLREYFQAEAIMNGSAVFDEIVSHSHMTTITSEGKPFLAEYFVTPPVVHSSWDDVKLKKWLEVRREGWSDVQNAPILTIDLNSNVSSNENQQFEYFVRSHLRNDPKLRSSMLVWKVSVEGFNSPTIDRLNTILQRVWDEMARLPWEDEEIVCSLSTSLKNFLTVETLSEKSQGFYSRQVERETMSRILARPLRVELGGLGNIHTWAWVDEGDLLAAVRPDFESILRPVSRDHILGNSFNTMMVARTPSLLFDFDKLSALFVKQIIPTQAVFYTDYPLFPTPARVRVIGPE